MRYENFGKNEYYHLSGKGVFTTGLFIDEEDRARFAFLLTHFQSPVRIYNTSWYAKSLLKKGSFSTSKERVAHILKRRSVELLAFSIIPHRFDVLIHNIEERLVSVYMHRVLTAYSKHFNSKYNKKGHVFAGPFRAAQVKQPQLSTYSALIHKTPKCLPEWKDGYEKYPWSTYSDYLSETSRWGDFVSTKPVLSKFKDKKFYKQFVTSHSTKEDLLGDNLFENTL